MQPQVWPLRMEGDSPDEGANYGSALSSSGYWWLNIMGRAKPGVSDSAAQAALNGELQRIVRGSMPVKRAKTFRSFGCVTAAADCLSSSKCSPGRWRC